MSKRKMRRRLAETANFVIEACERRQMLAPLSALPVLNSRLGAPVTVHLDFDGTNAFVFNNERSQWASGPLPGDSDPIPAFSIDGNVNDFTNNEIDAIRWIHAQVAEKFSPFNINVTTVPPAIYNDRQAVHAIMGGSDNDWYRQGAGGVAPTNAFTNERPNSAFTFTADAVVNMNNGLATLDSDTRNFIAETAAHEVGHTLGLRHQSVVGASGNVLVEYSNGDANTAPIMGASSLSANLLKRGIWFNGQCSFVNANNATVSGGLQDDLATITRSENGITYAADDFGAFTSSGAFTVTSATGQAQAAGIIETHGDQDAFSFTASGPIVQFMVNNAQFGGMLRPSIEMNPLPGAATGTISITNTNTSATLSATNVTPGGTYLIRVGRVGTEYGSLGKYTITGNVGTFATLSNGVVTVSGLNTDNQITVGYDSSTFQLLIENQIFGQTARQSFPVLQVNTVVINTPSGSDRIDVLGTISTIPITIRINDSGGDDLLVAQGTSQADFQVLKLDGDLQHNNTLIDFNSVERIVMATYGSNDVQRIERVANNLNVTVRGGDGDDGFDLAFGDLRNIIGNVTYEGEAGLLDTLVVQNGFAAGNWSHFFNAFSVESVTTGHTTLSSFFGIEKIVVGASENNDAVVGEASAQFAWEVYGRGGNDEIDIRGGSSALIRGGEGDDRLFIGGGNLIAAPTSAQVFGDGGSDTLVLDNRLSTLPITWNVYGFVSTVSTFNNKVFLGTPGVGGIAYDQFEGLEILGGSAVDTFTLDASLRAGVTLRGHGGNDNFSWNMATNVRSVLSPVLLDGGAGTNTLNVNEQSRALGVYELYADRLAVFSSFTDNVDFNYDNINSMTISMAPDANAVEIFGTSSDINGQITLLLGDGADEVILHPHNAQNNLTIDGLIGINGGPGSDVMTIDDTTSSVAVNYTFSNPFGAGTQNVLGMGASFLGIAAFEALNVNAGGGADQFLVNQYISGIPLHIKAGGGNDACTIGNGDASANTNNIGSFIFDGQTGTDSFSLNNNLTTTDWSYQTPASGITASRASNGFFLNLQTVAIEAQYILAGAAADVFTINQLASGLYTELRASGGIDRLLMGTGANTLENIRGPVMYMGETAGGDVTLSDTADTTADIVHQTATSVGFFNGDTLFGPGGSLRFSNLANFGTGPGLTMNLGSGADTVYAQPLAAARVQIDANAPTTVTGDKLNVALAGVTGAAVTGTAASGTVTSTNRQTLTFGEFEGTVSTDAVAPTVSSAAMNVNGTANRQSVDVQFSENMGFVTAASLQLTNLTTAQAVPAAFISSSYNATTRVAQFKFPGYVNGILPDGNYQGTILATQTADLFGNAPTTNIPFSFFFLSGDANRDRRVDIGDFSIVASRFNSAGTFSQGDFNYDGVTNVNDFSIVASKFNSSLPVPRTFAAGGREKPAFGLRPSGPAFANSRIADLLLDEPIG